MKSLATLGLGTAMGMTLGCREPPPSNIVLVDIPGGTFVMGASIGEPDEAPRVAGVEPFKIMQYEVSNSQFAEFAANELFRTDAERTGRGYVWDGTWRPVRGADWQHPRGPQTTVVGLEHHPAVRISVRDAVAFCAHQGLRLPTDAEWEFAARGTDRRTYPWRNEASESRTGVRRANFGTIRCCAPDASDGYFRTAPVGHFPEGASPFGILDMAGNVWEWTETPFPGPGYLVLRGGGWGSNPYCLRTSYRHANPPDVGLDMVGFRCAGDM